MSVRLVLTAQAEDLVGAFTAGLTEPGYPGGARAFCARYPVPAAFSALPVDEQLRLPAHQRRFACWLHGHRQDERLGRVPGTGRPSAGLHRRPPSPRSARPARRHRARSAPTKVWVRDQWSALAQLAALHGVLPEQVTSEQLDSGGDALLTAFARPGHPKASHKLRSALVRLRATLFHAGMTDTPPRLHRPNRGVVATAQWAAVARPA